MSPDHMGRFRYGTGFTLLETMLAIAISFAVVALVYSVYHSVIQTLEGQQFRQNGPERATQALHVIRDDLSRAFAPEDDKVCQFRLGGSDKAPDRVLSFCTLRRNEQEEDLRWVSVVHVEYAAIDSPKGLSLIAAEQPQAGPQALKPPLTNIVLETIASFSAQAWHSGKWVDVWGDDENAQVPRAVRLRLSMTTSPNSELETEIWIPIGQSYSTGIQRHVEP